MIEFVDMDVLVVVFILGILTGGMLAIVLFSRLFHTR